MKGTTSVELKMEATNYIIHINHVHPLLLNKRQPNLNRLHPYLIEELPLQLSQLLSTSDEAVDLPESKLQLNLHMLLEVKELYCQFSTIAHGAENSRG